MRWQNLKNKNQNLLVLLCSLVYFISYVTRINYQAIISELVVAEGISKDIASFAITGLFITYGTGQILCGILGDRIKPQHIILTGLIVTTIMNILLPLYVNPVYMTVIWCINGFAQAMMWPPIVKILTTYLDDYAYSKACVTVSYGSQLGTIVVYLLSSLFAAMHSWRMLFYVSTVAGVIGIILFKAGFEKTVTPLETVERKIVEQEQGEIKTFKLSSWILVIFSVMFAIMLQGSLRDGVTTWMPSLINEVYGIDTSGAIVTSIVLPVFSIFCFWLSQRIFTKFFKNEVVCAGVIFASVFASSVLLWLFYDNSFILTKQIYIINKY